ncbi:MAG: hypothetical protein AAF799_38025 [Myxococcota bacterium]
MPSSQYGVDPPQSSQPAPDVVVVSGSVLTVVSGCGEVSSPVVLSSTVVVAVPWVVGVSVDTPSS